MHAVIVRTKRPAAEAGELAPGAAFDERHRLQRADAVVIAIGEKFDFLDHAPPGRPFLRRHQHFPYWSDRRVQGPSVIGCNCLTPM